MKNGGQLPQCVGFIMDGNRRWARTCGKKTIEGHQQGLEVFKNMIGVVQKADLSHMVCYAFSTENWNRPQAEVEYLMQLMGTAINDMRNELTQGARNIHVRVIGERDRLPPDLQKAIVKLEHSNIDEPTLTVWLAISYGGRAELIEAAKKLAQSGEDFTEDTFSKFLWTKGMPDPDMIIRTGGELRLSNFLLWQAAYSELFFTETLWPDFGAEEFQSMLEEYAKRQRRRGQ